MVAAWWMVDTHKVLPFVAGLELDIVTAQFCASVYKIFTWKIFISVKKCHSRSDHSYLGPGGLDSVFYLPCTLPTHGTGQQGVFGLWRVCFPPCLVRPGRRLPVQGLSEGSLGYLDRLPAWRGPGTGLKLCHQGYQKSKRNLVYGIWSQ